MTRRQPQGQLKRHPRETVAADDIECARAVKIEAEIARRGISLKSVGGELVGPCPVCGGDDRFAISIKKQLWNCRICGVGGDIIDWVRHHDRHDFASAIARLTGKSFRTRTEPPKREQRDVYKDDQRRASKAAWCWSQREPITEGTPP